MLENLEKIKQAIEYETKYRYIDLQGKTTNFSKFIKNEIKKELKKSKKKSPLASSL